MNKILNVNGRRLSFNTKTAELIETKRTGKAKKRKIEKLYKTPHGHYFLHGQGGELTRWNGREDNIYLTEEQKKHWIKK